MAGGVTLSASGWPAFSPRGGSPCKTRHAEEESCLFWVPPEPVGVCGPHTREEGVEWRKCNAELRSRAHRCFRGTLRSAQKHVFKCLDA